MSGPRIGFVGGGMMGGGIIQGLIRRGEVAAGDIVVCEALDTRREELADRYGVTATGAYAAALDVDAVVVAVKPQEFAKAAREMREHLKPGALLISIMAGVRLETLLAALPAERAVRVMPNLGATVGESFSAWYATPGVTEADRAIVRLLLGAIGREYEVPAEGYIEMATAVVGSGPGYVALLIEALIDGAVYIGLPRELATAMVLQTVLGTSRVLQEQGGPPAVLRGQVMSPGGTTAEGILALERGAVRATLMQAVVAGFEKSKALGG
jgi:pyrroline-5-carboxylate reductase